LRPGRAVELRLIILSYSPDAIDERYEKHMGSLHSYSFRNFFPIRGGIAAALAVLAMFVGSPPLTRAQADLLPPPIPPPVSRDPPKAPVPGEAAQQEAMKLIRDLFKAEYARRAPADVQALAAKLLQQGRETKDDLVGQFVLLQQARELAVQAGDLATALAAVEETGKAYAVDGLGLKVQALAAAPLPASRPEASRALAASCLETIDEALEADRWDAAAELAVKAEAAARAAKEIGLLKRALQRKTEIEATRRESELAKAAEKALAAAPDDPAANLAVGRYAACVKGDWERGAARLAKGADAALKAAAEKELAKPAEPQAQAATGDAWWEAAEKSKGHPFEERWRGRARHWYETALPGLAGLARIKVERRLEQIVASPGDPSVASGLVGCWNFSGPLTKIRDLSPRRNHGAPRGGIKQVPGISGEALEFNGVDGYVELGAAGLPALDAPKSIACWVRFAAEAAAMQGVVCCAADEDEYCQFGCFEGRVVVWKSPGVILVDGGPVQKEVWRHYAYTFDGKKHRFYTDGKPVGSSEASPSRGKVIRADVGRTYGTGEYFGGLLDELRIYARPISESEVRQLFQSRR
jgi:hypothetical protein